MTSRRGALVACLWGLACLVTLPAVTTRIYASDEVQSFAWLRSLAFDGDADFENEYQHFYDAKAGGSGFHATFLEDRFTRTGRRINFTTVGPALLWSPFYLIGHVVAGATDAPQDGYSAPYVAAVAYGSACYGLLAVLISASLAHRICGRGLAAGISVLVATPLLFYVYVAPPFSHAASAFAVSLFLWTWLRVRESWSIGGVVLVGLTGGLMATMREQDLFFLAGPALDFLRWTVRRGLWREAIARSAAGTLAALAAYSPQIVAYQVLNGGLRAHESVANKMSWTSPHGLEVLFSPEHGLFAWTPVAVLGLAGLVTLATGRSHAIRPGASWVGILALVMVAVQVYINGSVESWSLAGAFGQRRFIGITPLLVLGLAALLAASAVAGPRPARVLWALIGLSVWWNLGLIVQFGTHRMDRQRLTLKDNAWVTFVELPREAPALAWRYFTDRASFYRQSRQ